MTSCCHLQLSQKLTVQVRHACHYTFQDLQAHAQHSHSALSHGMPLCYNGAEYSQSPALQFALYVMAAEAMRSQKMIRTILQSRQKMSSLLLCSHCQSRVHQRTLLEIDDFLITIFSSQLASQPQRQPPRPLTQLQKPQRSRQQKLTMRHLSKLPPQRRLPATRKQQAQRLT